jgi:hypothetical protein
MQLEGIYNKTNQLKDMNLADDLSMFNKKITKYQPYLVDQSDSHDLVSRIKTRYSVMKSDSMTPSSHF